METEKSFLSMSDPQLLHIFGTPLPGHTAAAIGAFDGLHLGHCHILGNTVRYARENGLSSAAILFDPLPSQFFGRIGANERLLLREEQETKLHEMGVEHVIFLPSTERLMNLSPEEFLSLMQDSLHVKRLFMGTDFSLGKGRTGTSAVLAAIGKSLGYTVEVIEKDEMDGDVISSTRIRSLLHAGEISAANRLLGYDFFFSGPIIHGEARGRKLGFPTLNVKIPEAKLILPNGVYAVHAAIDGENYAAVTNVGVRPTFGLEEKGIVVESFLLNAVGNFYGETAHLEFVEMLRPEIRFDSAEALKEQINRDIARAEKIF